MSFGMVCEDPMYDEDGVLIDEDFYYDQDDEGNWVEIHVDADGNPIVPTEEFGPYITINS